ncbi:MAG: outer membrane beta-barrel protein [Janthinobacterium lividum]
MKNAFSTLLLTGALASAATLVAAQTPATRPALAAGTVTGTATDSVSHQPLPFATVVLRPAAGAPLSTVTDERGTFSLAGVATGTYTLTVQYLGYHPSRPVAVVLSAGRSVATGPVALAPDRQRLGEVTVTATKAFIEQHADKLILNVAASPIAAGGTAADVLSRAPGVLEQGGSYVLRGKTVTVLLDGKDTNLGGEELKNLLASMPASGLDKVEVIANPSARYDAKGGAILNIITAKSKNFGTNGTATVGVGTGRYGRYNLGLSLNHRTAKLNVYGGYDRLENQVYSTSSAVRTLSTETQLTENGLETRHSQNNSAKLGFDYDLSKTSAVGVLLKGMLNDRSRDGENAAQLTTTTGALQQGSVVRTAGAAQFVSPSVNVYYKTSFDSLRRTLRVSADYFGYRKNWHNDYATRYLGSNGQETGPADLLRDNSPARNAVQSVSADYTQPLYKGTLEAGLKTTFTSTDNDIRWEQAPAGQSWITDLGKTNHFIYRENINAAYATYSRTVKKVELQAGLRAEQTNTIGTSLTLDQTTRRDYLNFFPSVLVQVSQSEKVQWGFSYSRKIDRFQFGIVNPFVTYISQYSYAQGNPNIRPSFSHNFELSHTYGSLLSTSLSYGHHTDVLIETFQRDAASQVVVHSFQNFRSAESLDGSITLMKPLLHDKWQTVTTLGVSFAKVNADAGSGLTGSLPSTFVSSNHTLTLTKSLKAEVSLMYMSPMTFGGIAYQSRFTTSFGVSKSILHSAGTLTLNVSDLFNTQQNRYNVLMSGIDSRNQDKSESRFLKLSFSYKFGNKNVKASQRRDTGIEAEKSRMDN